MPDDPAKREFPWGWLSFLLFLAGLVWLPLWSALGDALKLPGAEWMLHWLGAQGVALSVAAAWIAGRRRIYLFRFFAPLGVFWSAIAWWTAWGMTMMP